MNCIIVDDDIIARKSVEQCVSRTETLKLFGSCASIEEAHLIITKEKIDLIFLDIEMPQTSGMDYLRTFRDIPQIIIISAKTDYAAEAFDYDVADYIVKPVKYDRFLKAVQKCKTINENIKIDSAEIESIFVKKDGRYVNLNLSDINYIEALSDYIIIHTASTRYTVLSTMKAIENKLPQKDFIRIHRSYIVRIDKIKEIEDATLSCQGTVLPISRSSRSTVFARLNII